MSLEYSDIIPAREGFREDYKDCSFVRVRAGNMPLKAVREVTARFVKPPKLEVAISDYIHRTRGETELWPLHFLRRN